MAGVFISYSSKSKVIANLLKEHLRQKGIKAIWKDSEEIVAGQSIVGRIQDGVAKSACCVFILNQYSLNSNWCMAEVGAFWGARKPVIIFPTDPACDSPDFLHELKKADTPEEVVRACRKIIQDMPPPPSPPPAFVKTLQEGGLVTLSGFPWMITIARTG